MTKTIIRRSIGFALIAIEEFLIIYLTKFAWSFASTGLYWFIFVTALIGMGIFAISYVHSGADKIILRVFAILSGASLAIIILFAIISGEMVNAKRYQTIAEIKEGNFSQDILDINSEDFAVVDVETAKRLGDRTIAGISNSTWHDVDEEYNLIIYKGEQYRISPINYGGLFKYNKAKKTGIPGYVLVNAQTQEATLVQLDTPIKYSPSAYFSNNLKRHLRGQYHSYVFGTSFFEIDEQGNPYWITSIKTATIGIWGGKVENSFVITDACTGESTVYETSNLPDWVDHAYDLDYLMQITAYNLEYKNGFWNAVFGKADVNKLSYNYKDKDFAGYNSSITANGEVVFYTAITPANNAESMVGFITANPKNGEIKRYSCTGAEESSAQNAAQSLVQNFGYVATFPTVVNVDGSPTYFMALKDNAGLIQRYALCNISNYTIVVESSTIQDAVKLYREKLGKNIEEVDKSEMLSVQSTIENVYTAQIEGNTYFYFTLQGEEGLYMSSIENSNRQVLLKAGDTVKIEYISSDEDGVYLVTKIIF